MQFDNLPRAKPTPRREKKEPVFCVGWRAFVHWPTRNGHEGAPVPLLDDAGKQMANDLVDGQEVEILAWRPRSREGLVYHVRRVSDRTEWWIGAIFLRRQREAVAVPAVATSSLGDS